MALRWKTYAPNTVLKAVEVQDLADNGVIQVDTAADLADANLVNANVSYVTGEHKPYVRIAAGVGADKWKPFSGGLAGIGGWAVISAVTGSPKRHDYTDAGIEWAAFEWTGDGTLNHTDGLMDVLVVGGGGGGQVSTTYAGFYTGGGAGGVRYGIQNLPAVNGRTVTVGAGGTVGTDSGPGTAGGASSLASSYWVGGGGGGWGGNPQQAAAPIHGGGSYGGRRYGTQGAGNADGGGSSLVAADVNGTKLKYIGSEVIYGCRGIAGSGTPSTRYGSGGAYNQAGIPGVVIIRVPKDSVTATGGWV